MEYRTKEPENLPVLQRFGRWLALKQYQIEVTFGVYMFTPTEKFIFCTLSRSFISFLIPLVCCERCEQYGIRTHIAGWLRSS